MSVIPDAPSDPRVEMPWPDEADREPPRATGAPVPPPSASVAAPPRSAPRPAHPGLPIGRLRRVDPAELWRGDALAAWLADNLDEVTHLLGGELSEGSIDPSAPGTVAAIDAGGAPVRIVVELGPSSDETFGLLMRQLVSSGTRTAVWVCGTARDEHLTSVTWLNREISGRLHVLTVDAMRIDDSAPAPVFRLALRAADSTVSTPA
jgi:hypothetical protein